MSSVERNMIAIYYGYGDLSFCILLWRRETRAALRSRAAHVSKRPKHTDANANCRLLTCAALNVRDSGSANDASFKICYCAS